MSDSAAAPFFRIFFIPYRVKSANEHLRPIASARYISHTDLRIRGMENIGAVAAGIHLSMPTVATGCRFQCQQLQQPCRMTIEKVLSEDSTICCGSAVIGVPYLAHVGVQVTQVLCTGLMQFLSVHVVRIRVRSTVNDRVTVRT